MSRQPDLGFRPLVVWKFGGTSVADPGRLRAVAERMVAAHRAGHRVVTVLSAMGSSTDQLHELAYEMSPRPQLRELDALLSVGECISCALAAMAVHELGEYAVSLTGPQAGIVTDGSYGNARLHEIRPDRILAALDGGAIVLVTGYQGRSPGGDVTTLGRGGSDASAVAVAAALGLHECEIFTDVAGVYTADPRVAPDARLLRELGREEMLQLATAGSGVLQPRAVELAAAHDVDIHVRSSFTTDAGTWILEERPMFEVSEVTGIAHRERETLYAVRDMSPATISAVLAQRGAAFGALVRQGGAVHFTVPGADETEVAAAFVATGARMTVQNALGTVSVVSTGIDRRPDVTARALSVLADEGIEPQLVTSTPSRVSFHIPAATVAHAVRLLHGVFGLQAPERPAPVRSAS
ncbi:aspartate kinase [Pseudonocardia sp. H11422]|uniref:aspartate kinase n=1 Tax=Pseudonocardia sp. H11422 TaxID=2835866 RepID=UPI001BDC0318|nr:aspartate kinase [Pseudonocardia sp. H11422]